MAPMVRDQGLVQVPSGAVGRWPWNRSMGRGPVALLRAFLAVHRRHRSETRTTEQGKPMPPERVSKQFALARSAAGLAVRFHDLRHRTATLLGALRDAHGTPIVPPKVAQRILRHGRIETTLAVYIHVTDTDQLSAAMHAFDACLD